MGWFTSLIHRFGSKASERRYALAHVSGLSGKWVISGGPYPLDATHIKEWMQENPGSVVNWTTAKRWVQQPREDHPKTTWGIYDLRTYRVVYTRRGKAQGKGKS